MPAIVSAPMASGAAAGRMPHVMSPMCRSLPCIGGPGFAHLRRQDHADGFGRRPHRQRRAKIADDRRDDVAAPRVAVAELVAAPEPDARGVDGLLTERSESLALERRVTVANFAAGEERLQPVVGGARQDHAAQDLAALVGRQRGAERGAAEESVAGLDELVDRDAGSAGARRLQASSRRARSARGSAGACGVRLRRWLEARRATPRRAGPRSCTRRRPRARERRRTENARRQTLRVAGRDPSRGEPRRPAAICEMLTPGCCRQARRTARAFTELCG